MILNLLIRTYNLHRNKTASLRTMQIMKIILHNKKMKDGSKD